MYDTLVVEVLKTLEDLCHVDTDEVLGELAIGLADGMQGAILTIPTQQSVSPIPTFLWYSDALLEDDVQTVLGLDEADILDDVVMVEVLEEVDFGLSFPRQQISRPPCS